MRRNSLLPKSPKSLLAAVLLAVTPFAAAQTTPLPSAHDVMAQAQSAAAAGHKNIVLTFSASWCGPCKLFERFLEDPTIHPIMDKAFVMARLDVGEHPGDKLHADSPGAEDLMSTLGGKDTGYPFIIMLNPAGKPIIDSLRTPKKDNMGSNIGYPALPIEVDWFMQMLRKAAPTLSAQETTTIRTWLTAHGHN